MKYNRILLKLSGESLQGKLGHSIDSERLHSYALQIQQTLNLNVSIGIVIGGGNIFRGLKGACQGHDRVKGDYMGMCATVINSLALSSALDMQNVPNKVFTSIRMEPIGELFSKSLVMEYLEKGYVCIFAGGTGNPYFTTDTAAVLRAIEIEAEVMLKGTRVNGVYTSDPEKDSMAVMFNQITYDEVLSRGLKVMDLTATALAKDNNLPIHVFNMDEEGNLIRLLQGENIGTKVNNS